ncbi:(2Fe-2S) ferredoxin domain-containing protein [Streptomyces sp. NPDC021012]|uniref:(2Fe-2S) ferredoxin domain-containing protein n=1 Tax=Streptomyces sp. NPDC021012 TaxID=3365107 RepID=UPI0037A3525F
MRPLREVVQPSAEGRKNGGPPVWLGLVNGPDATTDTTGTTGTTAWIKDSGPDLTGPSDILDLYAFRPSRRIRAELHDDA